jgi:putative peptidoglycan lipid II flippase
MFPLKHGGIALATSIASAVNVGMLWVILKRRVGAILDGEFTRSVAKTALASLVMGASIFIIGLLIPWNASGPFSARLMYLLLCVVGGGIAYFAAALLFGSPELMLLTGSLRRRIAGRGKG